MHQKYKLKHHVYYFGLFLVFAGSFAVSKTNVPFISQHISNFGITGALLTLSLYPDLLTGKLTRTSLYVAIALWTAINVVIEFFVSLGDVALPGLTLIRFNTPDPLDALFGIASIILFTIIVLHYCSQPVADAETA